MQREPTYPVVVQATELPPWDGPSPYRSLQDPAVILPMFQLDVPPADWARYLQWLQIAEDRKGTDILVQFGTNIVTVADCLSLAPEQWLFDNILHYFTSTMKRTFKIRTTDLVFFSSYFLTLLFNEGHADPKVADTFSYKNVQNWLSKKMERAKTSLTRIKTLVFFQNQGRQHWITYVIFQDLKIIEQFDSMGGGDETILKGLYRWLFLEYQRIGIRLDSSQWKLYTTRRSTPRQRNGYDCGVFSILFALHVGLRLNIDNINQAQISNVRCRLLLNLLERAGEDNIEALPVVPDRQEADANNPLLLLDDSEGVSDEQDDDSIEDFSDADDGKEDHASQASDHGNSGENNAENNENVDGAQDNDDNNGDNDNVAGNDNAGNGAGDDNAGNNENANEDQDDDQPDKNGNYREGGEQEDDDSETSTDDDEEENKDASEVVGEEDGQIAFEDLPSPLSPGQAEPVADMSLEAENVLSPLVGSLSIQDDELASPMTSPVFAAISPLLTEDWSRHIDKELTEAEARGAEERARLPDAPIQSDETEELLPLMPDLSSPDLDTRSEETKEKYISATTGYHGSGYFDGYSDDDDDLVPDAKREEKISEHVDEDGNLKEAVDVLINLKDGLPEKKAKAKPTKKKEPKSKKKGQDTSAGPSFAKGREKSRTKEKNISQTSGVSPYFAKGSGKSRTKEKNIS